MASFEYLVDGHHVDEAGNLIACTYVDFRDPADRFPIATLQKASSKRHAIPGCETVRISKPACFLDQSEGVASDGEVHHGTSGWIYCVSIKPETAEEQAAWRKAMPAGCDAVSPIRRPRAFARALGAMTDERAGPRGRIVLLRNTVEGRAFCTAHRSQTVYHSPVACPEDPTWRLERASSDLALLLLLVFVKDAAHRGRREYRFAVWAEEGAGVGPTRWNTRYGRPPRSRRCRVGSACRSDSASWAGLPPCGDRILRRPDCGPARWSPVRFLRRTVHTLPSIRRA